MRHERGEDRGEGICQKRIEIIECNWESLLSLTLILPLGGEGIYFQKFVIIRVCRNGLPKSLLSGLNQRAQRVRGRAPQLRGVQHAAADAAVALLRRHPAVDGTRVGLFGHSQAGWVAPAAARMSGADFQVVLSGGGVSPEEQEVFRSRAEAGATGLSPDDAAHLMRLKWRYASTGEGWEAYLDTVRDADPRLVAVVGCDARPWEDVVTSRADSIHFVGLDGAGKGGIVGVPRDSWVPIAGGGRGKINSALANYGTEGMISPMVLLDSAYWSETLPVERLRRQLEYERQRKQNRYGHHSQQRENRKL